MPKPSKQDLRDLRKKSTELPFTYFEREVTKFVTGAQLKKDVENSGDEDLIKAYKMTWDDPSYNPESTYPIKYSEQVPVNHYHRMKKIFKAAKTRQQGMDDLNEYIAGVVDLNDPEPYEIKSEALL